MTVICDMIPRAQKNKALEEKLMMLRSEIQKVGEEREELKNSNLLDLTELEEEPA